MTGGEFRIFLSAVTSEFRSARDALAADLRSRGAFVKVQSDFRQEADADTTIRKLHDYIRDCSAVVCVIGNRSGACPPPAAAARFAHMLPPGVAEASYTQWEFFFARHYRRRLSIYIARADYVPDRPAPSGPDRADLQAALLRHIVDEQGLDRDYFSNVDQLCRAVLKEDWARKLAPKPILLPYQSIGSLFKGRDDFMRRLRDSLTRANGAQTAIISKALYGLSGIGKTRAAVEYAWAHQDDYTALLFAIAESPEAMRRNLAALAGLLLLPEREAAEDAVRLRAVLDWLKANPGWLLILDNVDTPAALAEAQAIMAQLTGGHVVMTSRLGNFAPEIDPLDLDVLRIDAASDFLLERTGGRRRPAADDPAAARALARELGQLALALEHAGAYIAKHRTTFGQYQNLLRTSRDKVFAWSDPALTHYPRAIAVTWQASVAQLPDAARHLLELLAWLAPEPVPEFLLEVAVSGTDLGDPADALADLAAYSLVTRDPKQPRFTVHRLVQDVTRRGMAGFGSRRWLEEALNWINAAFTGNPQDVRTWPRLDPLAPHTITVTQYADAAGIALPTARLMADLGILFHVKARHSEAEPLMRRALAMFERAFGPGHPEVATNLNNLAVLLRATNRLAEAEPLMRRALAIDEHGFGPDHPDVARDLNNLGGLLRATNQIAEAEPLYRRALAINEAAFGPDHPSVATALNNLAALLQATNRLAEAEALMRRALAIHEAAFGPDHPEVPTDLNNLAELLRATSRPGEAEPLYRRALAINEAAFGPDHPSVAATLNNLAALLQATNRLAEAELLMRRALAIDEAAFEPDHPKIALRLSNLAHMLQATDRLAEAEPLMRRALAILIAFETSTGHSHPNRSGVLCSYFVLLAVMGRNEAEIRAAIASLGGEAS